AIRDIAIDQPAHARRQNVHEVVAFFAAARKLSDIERSRASAHQGLEVLVQAMLDAERLAKVPARPLADDAELADLGLSLLREHEAIDHLVNRPIAAERDHERASRKRTIARELDGMAPSIRHRDVDLAERPLDGRSHRAERLPCSAPCGSRIDDDERLLD